MCVTLYDYASTLPITPASAKQVLTELAHLLDPETGKCCPTLDTLKARTSLGRNTIQVTINRLEAAGFITRIRSRHQNHYVLHLPGAPNPEDIEPARDWRTLDSLHMTQFPATLKEAATEAATGTADCLTKCRQSPTTGPRTRKENITNKRARAAQRPRSYRHSELRAEQTMLKGPDQFMVRYARVRGMDPWQIWNHFQSIHAETRMTSPGEVRSYWHRYCHEAQHGWTPTRPAPADRARIGRRAPPRRTKAHAESVTAQPNAQQITATEPAEKAVQMTQPDEFMIKNAQAYCLNVQDLWHQFTNENPAGFDSIEAAHAAWRALTYRRASAPPATITTPAMPKNWIRSATAEQIQETPARREPEPKKAPADAPQSLRSVLAATLTPEQLARARSGESSFRPQAKEPAKPKPGTLTGDALARARANSSRRTPFRKPDSGQE